MNKLIAIWNNYWFENRPSKISLAAIRIAVYISILQSLQMIWSSTPAEFLSVQNSSRYSPVGLLQILGTHIPPVQFFIIVKYVALFSSLFALVGLLTFTSSLVSFISNQFLFCLLYSWGQPWTHAFNVIFLLQLVILFAPTGTIIAIDNLISRARNKINTTPNCKYVWVVRLAQLIVALMFFNGFFYKWLSSPIALRWAFSDSLRNIIISEFYQQKIAIPQYVVYILNHPFLYKLLALLNLITQFSIILSCVFVRKPWLRLFIAFLVVLEFAGFKLIMNLESYYWYWLAVVFVDWDYFIALLKRINISDYFSSKTITPRESTPTKFISFFILFFIAFYIVVAFNPRYGLQEKLKPYPFTRFALYNLIEAEKPYGKHLPLPEEQFLFKVYTDSLNGKASNFLDILFYQNSHYYYSEKNKSKFLIECKSALQKAGYNHVTSIALYKDYSEIAPYPYMPGLHLLAEGLQCKMDTLGTKYIVVHTFINNATHEPAISINFLGYDSNMVAKFFTQHDLSYSPAPIEFKYIKKNNIVLPFINKGYIRIEAYSKKSQPVPDVYYIEPG